MINKKRILALLALLALTIFAATIDRPALEVYEPVIENKQVIEPPVEEAKPVEKLIVVPKEVTPPKPVAEPVKPKSVGLAENEIESIVNNSREENGLKRLSSNQKLRNSACAKAQHMFDNQYWAHNAPDGTTPWSFIEKAGYSYQEVGENIARGYATASAMVTGWLGSPTHRDNVLNSRFVDQGICSKSGELLGDSVTITVQHLGK